MHRVRQPEKEEQVKLAITAILHLSVRKIAWMASVSIGTAHTTLCSLKLYLYRISIHQELKPPDYAHPANFCQWFNHFMQHGWSLGSSQWICELKKFLSLGEWEPTRFCWNRLPSTENWNMVFDIAKMCCRPIFSPRDHQCGTLPTNCGAFYRLFRSARVFLLVPARWCDHTYGDRDNRFFTQILRWQTDFSPKLAA